ncbi:hypothetical protein KIW84_035220 [Lathyrus oleraceus]|uniref:THO complex subunitTHOC2 C-terminal domain-containing protein n=1 Tax=Pisum sativum TaxID=3888 RepID=A0A9D5B260_PEA|nr:hypothetical protein KIW84_035220 [Pisum sativum]
MPFCILNNNINKNPISSSYLLGTVKTMLPSKAWNSLSPDLYATFWGLTLYDLSAITKRKKEKERIQESLDRLISELHKHEENVASVSRRLSYAKDKWLSSCPDTLKINMEFLQHAPYIKMVSEQFDRCHGTLLQYADFLGNASSLVSALNFCLDTLHLAVGDESGVVRLYGLIRSLDDTTSHFVTENGTNVHNVNQGDELYCKAVFSLQNSTVCGLQFANLGGNLAVGYEHGQGLKSSQISISETLNETANKIIEHAETFVLIDHLCSCLATSGSGLIAGFSNMLWAASEACRAAWLLFNVLNVFVKRNSAILFPISALRRTEIMDHRHDPLFDEESTKNNRCNHKSIPEIRSCSCCRVLLFSPTD